MSDKNCYACNGVTHVELRQMSHESFMAAHESFQTLVAERDEYRAQAETVQLVHAENARLRMIVDCFNHMGGGMALHPCPTPEDYRKKGELIYDLAAGLVSPESYMGFDQPASASSEVASPHD